jgi:hypothetical protein
MSTGIISLNSVNQLIFVMVKSCVFFAVWIEFLNIIQMSFDFKGFISLLSILYSDYLKEQINFTFVLHPSLPFNCL